MNALEQALAWTAPPKPPPKAPAKAKAKRPAKAKATKKPAKPKAKRVKAAPRAKPKAEHTPKAKPRAKASAKTPAKATVKRAKARKEPEPPIEFSIDITGLAEDDGSMPSERKIREAIERRAGKVGEVIERAEAIVQGEESDDVPF